MVNLVDDDDFKCLGVEALDRLVTQRLHHGENVTAEERLLTISKDFSEVRVLENRGVSRPTLIEDAAAVSDKQEAGLTAELVTEPAVVQSSHDRLAGPCRGDEQVAVAVMSVALSLQLFEHSRLVRLRC